MSKIFSFNAGVWVWPGVGGWHFVNVPIKISEDIREKYGKGMIKVMVTTGKSVWDTALFPHKQSKGYLLSIKKIIRKKENIYESDVIKISFKLKK